MPSVSLSTATISAITDKVIIPELKQKRQRPLGEAFIPFVQPDAIHYKVREDGSPPEQGARLHGAGAESEGKKKAPGSRICRKAKALTSGYPYRVTCKTVELKTF